MVEKSGKQHFHYDMKELIEPITKAVTGTSHELLEKIQSTTTALEASDESNVQVKASELMNKNRVIDSSLIRPIAKPLHQQMKVNFDYMTIQIGIIGMIT